MLDAVQTSELIQGTGHKFGEATKIWIPRIVITQATPPKTSFDDNKKKFQAFKGVSWHANVRYAASLANSGFCPFPTGLISSRWYPSEIEALPAPAHLVLVQNLAASKFQVAHVVLEEFQYHLRKA
jgi:hypothetical protein